MTARVDPLQASRDRWLADKLAEGEQRKAAMAEEAKRIFKHIREHGLKITPEANEWDYSDEGQAFIDDHAEVDTRGGIQYGAKED